MAVVGDRIEHLGVVAAALAAVGAHDLSPEAVSLHLSAGRELVTISSAPAGLCREHDEGLILALQERGRTPSGVSAVDRSLQQLPKYLGQEAELDRSRWSTRRHRSSETREARAVRRRPAGAAGDPRRPDFVALRDTALLRLFIATGGRRAEVAGLNVDAVGLDTDTVRLEQLGSRGGSEDSADRRDGPRRSSPD